MPSGRLVLKTVGVIKRPPGPGKSPCCQVGARPRQMSKSRQVVLSQPPAFRGGPGPPPARGSQMGPSGLRGGVASAKIFGGGSGPLAPGGGCPPALWFDRGTHTWAQIFGDPGGVLQFAPGPLPRARSAPRALPDAPPGMRAGAPTPDGRIRPTPCLFLRHRFFDLRIRAFLISCTGPCLGIDRQGRCAFIWARLRGARAAASCRVLPSQPWKHRVSVCQRVCAAGVDE